ncbi:MAG: GLPGLI family protein [Ferruginibacter sp.]
MKTIIFFIAFIFITTLHLNAQQFINKATVEYEVKTNIKKTLGNSSWDEMMRESMPQFKTGYYNFTFAGDKSVYKFDHWDEKAKMPEFLRRSDEENVWYFDHATGKYNMQKNVYGSNFNVEDSIINIEWKLENENRVIAGFNCRKAVGKIMDSVYVFAFYTDEITVSGGPCSVSGLPGLILGLTIPRMYTSWIATKVMVNGVDESIIKPATAKKYFTTRSLKTTIKDRVKEWISEDDPDSNKWAEQLFWNTAL